MPSSPPHLQACARSLFGGFARSPIMEPGVGGESNRMARSWTTQSHLKSSFRTAGLTCPFLWRTLFVFTALLLPLSLHARAKPVHATLDSRYVSALAMANRFLSAWRAQDRENGLVMLSDAAKRGKSEDQLADFFSPGDDAAFEIGRGTKLKAGRYAFPVRLLEITSGNRPRSRVWQMVVVGTGGEDWAVDTLP